MFHNRIIASRRAIAEMETDADGVTHETEGVSSTPMEWQSSTGVETGDVSVGGQAADVDMLVDAPVDAPADMPASTEQ